MLAVIKTGGKQYVVECGDVLTVEKLDAKADEEIVFDEVLLVADEADVMLGAPLVSGMSVRAKVLEHTRGDKVWGIKHKPKKRYKKKFGHRQELTKVEIVAIEKK